MEKDKKPIMRVVEYGRIRREAEPIEGLILSPRPASDTSSSGTRLVLTGHTRPHVSYPISPRSPKIDFFILIFPLY